MEQYERDYLVGLIDRYKVKAKVADKDGHCVLAERYLDRVALLQDLIFLADVRDYFRA